MPIKSNTAEPQKQRRRWFQFRLRAMLIGVALLAIPSVYVGHEARIVAKRSAWIAGHPLVPDEEPFLTETDNSLPPIRRWLGDIPQDMVFVNSDTDEKTAADLFPEAIFWRPSPREPVGHQRNFTTLPLFGGGMQLFGVFAGTAERLFQLSLFTAIGFAVCVVRLFFRAATLFRNGQTSAR